MSSAEFSLRFTCSLCTPVWLCVHRESDRSHKLRSAVCLVVFSPSLRSALFLTRQRGGGFFFFFLLVDALSSFMQTAVKVLRCPIAP